MTDASLGDMLTRARTLLAAASTARPFSLRAVYVAEARKLIEAEAARLETTRTLLDAQETELTRLARQTT